MNAERLHAVLRELKSEIDRGQIQSKLQELLSALQNVVNQSSGAQYQAALSTARTAIDRALADSPSDGFGPGWRDIVEAIGAAPLLGERLRGRLEEIFARNEITPATALNEVQGISQAFDRLKAATDQGVQGLAQLEIGSEDMKVGEYELGVLIPRDRVGNSLGPLTKELRDIRFIVRSFSELTTGKAGEPEIRRISSSEFLFDLIPETVIALGALGRAITWVLDRYEQVRRILDREQEMRDEGVPEDILEPLKKHAENLIEQQIQEQIPVLMEEYWKGADTHRRNEIENHLRHSLRMIANRVDQGFGFEVRAGEPPEIGGEGDEEVEGEAAASQAAFKLVSELEPKLQYISRQGPGVLALPEPDSDDFEETDEEGGG